MKRVKKKLNVDIGTEAIAEKKKTATSVTEEKIAKDIFKQGNVKTESAKAGIENLVNNLTPKKDVSDNTNVNTSTQTQEEKKRIKKILNISKRIITLSVTNAISGRLKR